MNWKGAGIFVLAAVLVANFAHAHHSGAMFDRSKTVTLQGTVKEFLFTNPHCWIRLLVPDGSGSETEWDIEASAPSRLVQWGISPTKLHTADKISLTMHPLRDGRPGGILVDITFADGTHASTESDANGVAK
jgi:hypothetical protein